MKNFRKKIIRVLIIALLLDVIYQSTHFKELNQDYTNSETSEIGEMLGEFVDLTGLGETTVAAANDYGSLFSTDPEIIRRINYAVSLYGPGQYFTKNGKACTCHGKKVNHVNSGSNCNCLRYVKINGSKVDLKAVQCFGYAMYMQMCILGTTQFLSSGSFTFYYGSNKKMTGKEMERFFVEHANVIHPGTHLRCKYAGHSVVIMAVDYVKGTVTFIDCNNIAPCKIRDFTTMSWSDFAARYITINYIAVYKNYYSYYSGAPDPSLISQIQQKLPTPTPSRKPATPTPTPSPADYPIGLYKVTANPRLNLREEPYTYASKIAQLPNGLEVEIFDFAYNKGGHHWGLIDTEQGSGWSSMGYLTLIQEYTPTPTPTYAPADYETGSYTVTATSLQVREDHSTNSKSVGKLAKDTTVDMLVFVNGDNDTRWGYVSIEEKNIQGWVSMDYMQLIPTATPTPTNTPTAEPSLTPSPEPTKAEQGGGTPIPTEALPTNTPVPTEKPEDGEKTSVGRTIGIIVIIALCIAGEAILFVYLKSKRERRWQEKGHNKENKQTSGEIKTRINKMIRPDNKKRKK